MSQTINIYCDESCHLRIDGNKAMVLGMLSIEHDIVPIITEEIKGIKRKYEMSVYNEIKWRKVSTNKVQLYEDLVQLFLTRNELSFRCVVVPNKEILNHEYFHRTHANFYYVMFYYGLKHIINRENTYNIYFDLKDSKQKDELKKLKEILHNNKKLPIEKLKLQTVISYESQLLQLCDLLTGAVSYISRGLSSSDAKVKIAKLLESETNQDFLKSSPYKESKFNVFVWDAQDLGSLK